MRLRPDINGRFRPGKSAVWLSGSSRPIDSQTGTFGQGDRIPGSDNGGGALFQKRFCYRLSINAVMTDRALDHGLAKNVRASGKNRVE
ncbi:hypothetical protein BH11ARM2_BH11ARM2_39820 [soil metagenome]